MVVWLTGLEPVWGSRDDLPGPLGLATPSVYQFRHERTPPGAEITGPSPLTQTGLPGVFERQDRTAIVLLAGGDKRTQSDDIDAARRLARNL